MTNKTACEDYEPSQAVTNCNAGEAGRGCLGRKPCDCLPSQGSRNSLLQCRELCKGANTPVLVIRGYTRKNMGFYE